MNTTNIDVFDSPYSYFLSEKEQKEIIKRLVPGKLYRYHGSEHAKRMKNKFVSTAFSKMRPPGAKKSTEYGVTMVPVGAICMFLKVTNKFHDPCFLFEDHLVSTNLRFWHCNFEEM